MDGEVLIGVFIVHVHRNVKVHAADGVHQGLEPLQVHQHRVVHRDAQLAGYRVRQQLHAPGVVGEVNFAVFPVDAGFGVPGDADAVYIAVWHVHGHQDVCVRAAVVVVPAGEQDGPELGLALVVGAEGLRLLVGEAVRNGGGVYPLDHDGVPGFLVRGPEVNPDHGVAQPDEDEQQQQGHKPGAALPAAKSGCHGKPPVRPPHGRVSSKVSAGKGPSKGGTGMFASL